MTLRAHTLLDVMAGTLREGARFEVLASRVLLEKTETMGRNGQQLCRANHFAAGTR